MFIPWVEKKEYEQQTPRTLILGESHYGNSHIVHKYPLEEKTVRTLDAVMALLKPDYCVCLGYRMWGELWWRIERTPIQVASDIGPKGAFWSERFRCVFHGTKHPSGRGFRWAEWHRYITNLRRERWG